MVEGRTSAGGGRMARAIGGGRKRVGRLLPSLASAFSPVSPCRQEDSDSDDSSEAAAEDEHNRDAQAGDQQAVASLLYALQVPRVLAFSAGQSPTGDIDKHVRRQTRLSPPAG